MHAGLPGPLGLQLVGVDDDGAEDEGVEEAAVEVEADALASVEEDDRAVEPPLEPEPDPEGLE